VETRARVRDARDGRVWLECASVSSACGACGGTRGCALRWVAGSDNASLEIVDPGIGDRPLRPGDGVTVEIDEGELLRAAALAYVPPLAGMLAGSALGAVGVPGSEPAALAGAVLGLVTGWGIARAWLRRFPPRYRVRPAGHA
jgi:sigma-E factor negative regulatory protein RseC